MTIKAGDIVLIDTNVIIEAHRVSCWPALSQQYQFHTVATVMEETQTGFQNRTSPQQIDFGQLSQSMTHIYTVTEPDRIRCTFSHPDIMGLDPGEQDLLIYASKAGQACWLLASPDKAAMRVAHKIGWLEQMVSLESLLKSINLYPKLAKNYTQQWHSNTSQNIRLGLL
ncbi:MAG: hypothetical protein QM578_22115 [Pantoea sp.]|uniref:hypothetical protein n=1 Tax=Pantoea sp. TaxID=69393 RepID=UPI0039E25272